MSEPVPSEPTDGAAVADATPPPPPPPPPSAVDAIELSPQLVLSLLLPLLLALYFLFGRKSGGGGKRRLLLFGPVGSGKTALYHRLKHGRIVPTVSSMEPAAASFALNGADGGAPVHVCDMPGTGRLREELKAEAASSACLVCVVDGTQLVSQAREAAGMLFDIFVHESVARRPPPLLVAVNKADVAGCAAPAAAKKALEQEVQRVRLARTTMEDTSGRAKQMRGVADDSAGPFSFDQLGCEVSFTALSAKKPDVAGLLSFAQKHVR